jgi:ankyrin repeat protein
MQQKFPTTGKEHLIANLIKNPFDEKYIKRYLREFGPNGLLHFKSLDEPVTLLIYYIIYSDYNKIIQLIQLIEQLAKENDNQAKINYEVVTPTTNYSALHVAVSNAIYNTNYDIRIIRLLLKKGEASQLLVKNTHGEIPIIYTTYARSYLCRKVIQQTAMPPNSPTEQKALAIKRQVVANLLLEKNTGPQLLSCDNQQRIALHHACFFGHVALVHLFLKTSAEKQLLAQEKNGHTPILLAIWAQLEQQKQFAIAYKTLQLLVDALLTSSPDQVLIRKNEYDHSPLLLLCLNYREIDPQQIIIQKLLRLPNRNAQLKLIWRKNINPGHLGQPRSVKFIDKQPLIEVSALSTTLMMKNDELFYQLTSYDCLEQYLCGYTPLWQAAQVGDVKKVEHLLKNGPKAQLTHNSTGGGPIHIAHSSCIDLLLTVDPSQIHLTDNQGNTPLHIACLKGDFERANIFIARGANKNALNDEKNLPLHLASIGGDLKVVELLSENIEHQAHQHNCHKHTPFLLAVASEQDEIAMYLLENSGAKKAELCDSEILRLAIFYCSDKLVERILDTGVSINGVVCTQHHLTPLHIAYNKCRLEIFLSLLKRGADLTQGNCEGETVFHLACRDGDEKFISALLKQPRLNINQRNTAGCSGIILATFYGHKNIVELLLAHGATVDKTDINRIEIFQDALRHSVAGTQLNIINDETEDLKNLLKKMVISSDVETPISDICRNATQTAEKSLLLSNQISNQTSTTTANPVGARAYLKQIGFTDDDINEFHEEQKIKKALHKATMQHNRYHFYQEPSLHQESNFSFLNGKITSDCTNLISVRGSSIPMFFYRDETVYSRHDSSNVFLRQENIKLDGRHLKKLNDDKGQYIDTIKINDEICEVRYTYEWKRNRLNRVLVFEVRSFPSGACLLIPGRELETGLHENADIKSLRESLGIGKIIEIRLPSNAPNLGVKNC